MKLKILQPSRQTEDVSESVLPEEAKVEKPKRVRKKVGKPEPEVESAEQIIEPVQETAEQNVDPAISEELYWAEVQLAGSMAEVERKRFELEEMIEASRLQVGEASDHLKSLESDLSDLREQHKDETDKLLSLARKLMKVASGKTLPTELDSKESRGADGWRIRSTEDLMSGIRGLSKKKMDSLVELAPTVGDLEDLRGSASRKHVPFEKELPRGIGETVAAQIEDRLALHVRDWMKRQNDPDRTKLADDLLASTRLSATEWTTDDCIPKESDDPHLHAGFTAYRDGLAHTEFISEDRTKAQFWMSGWVGAERIEKLQSSMAS
jgi:hypothetical protein